MDKEKFDKILDTVILGAKIGIGIAITVSVSVIFISVLAVL